MLFTSPVSPEIAEASVLVGVDGFVCSTSQVGPNNYTGFDHERLFRFLTENNALDMYIERDHLGRNGEDIKYWLDMDQDYGFTGAMLHVFNRAQLPDLSQWDLKFQLGPGEDSSQLLDCNLFRADCEWISFPTGCLIDNGRNVGKINEAAIQAARQYGRKIRGHNCDYLPPHKMRRIAELCDGINIAPQLGVIQSCFYLMCARARGYDIAAWLDACHDDYKNRARWGDSPELVGHYHFDKVAWRDDVRAECVLVIAEEIRRWKLLSDGAASECCSTDLTL